MTPLMLATKFGHKEVIIYIYAYAYIMYMFPAMWEFTQSASWNIIIMYTTIILLLSLSTHVPEGYGSHSLCVCVCACVHACERACVRVCVSLTTFSVINFIFKLQ